MTTAGLDRFVAAQEGIYRQALAELKAGRKTSHWMWFVFPQIAGLGQSETAHFYGISGIDEARAYLADPLLGARLVEGTRAILDWERRRDATELLGPVDAMKLRSSMTIFEHAGGDPCFAHALDAFFNGQRCERTLALLDQPGRGATR